jgi:hypothetical protein
MSMTGSSYVSSSYGYSTVVTEMPFYSTSAFLSSTHFVAILLLRRDTTLSCLPRMFVKYKKSTTFMISLYTPKNTWPSPNEYNNIYTSSEIEIPSIWLLNKHLSANGILKAI